MHVINARNVRDAYAQGMEYLRRSGIRQDSRAGPVIVAPTPVTTVTARPQERVLLDWVRDSNPFFCLGESAWMLAGRNDTGFLDRFVGDFGRRFAEVDRTEHDAYGFRWRKHFGFDQLDACVKKLKANPDDRQAVVQMWDGATEYPANVPIHEDRPEPADDLLGTWKTRPCNTHCYLRVRSQHVEHDDRGEVRENVLDLTVLCRSNDIIWGAHGANAVHFSMLQEYLAARIGVGVGTMYQVSNNYHAYAAVFDPLMARYDAGELSNPAHARHLQTLGYPVGMEPDRGWGIQNGVELPYGPTQILVDRASSFDEELHHVLARVEAGVTWTSGETLRTYDNKFLSHTFLPMCAAHQAHKHGHASLAEGWAKQILAPDWRQACEEWLLRRRARRAQTKSGEA